MTAASIDSTDDLSGHEGSVRKRVGKACDRCRLKKSKCDGSKPCGRCKADNQVCLFGERKKAHDKVFPKGYVELLEHQQLLLVHALQSVYRQYWTGPALPEVDGNPLVHDMLDSLGLLQHDGCSSPVSFEDFHFEEDTAKMQSRLTESEAGKDSPAMSPGSLTSQSSLFQDTFQPATPQDTLGFPRIPPTFTQSPVQMAPAAQMLQFTQELETSGAMNVTFQPTMSPKLSNDPESLGLFSNQYPYIPAFNDFATDFMEEDSFGNLVDLGPP